MALTVLGVAAVVLLPLGFSACGSPQAQSTPSATPSPLGMRQYHSAVGDFTFSYDSSRYVVNDNQAYMLTTWFGKGANFAMALLQRGKSPSSMDCANLSIDAKRFAPSARNASVATRKVFCSQAAIRLDEIFGKAMTKSKSTIVEMVTVNGMPGFMVERVGRVEGTLGRFRTLVFASNERSYLVNLWTPESERRTEVNDFNHMMNTFVAGAS